jgi:HEAT repeat protein
LEKAPSQEHHDLLCALNDLRAEAAPVLLPMVVAGTVGYPELAVEVLLWSKDPRVGPALRNWAARCVPMDRRALKRGRAAAPRRRSVSGSAPYRSILRALRAHPSPETEGFLLLAAQDWDPTYRAAALGSLGWWEPLDRGEVLRCLGNSRRDPSPEVRHAARAALARLGERQALQWFRQALSGEEPQMVHEAIQVVACEGLTLLWPDLDRLADAEDNEVAHQACEALELLREDLDRRRGK